MDLSLSSLIMSDKGGMSTREVEFNSTLRRRETARYQRMRTSVDSRRRVNTCRRHLTLQWGPVFYQFFASHCSSKIEVSCFACFFSLVGKCIFDFLAEVKLSLFNILQNLQPKTIYYNQSMLLWSYEALHNNNVYDSCYIFYCTLLTYRYRYTVLNVFADLDIALKKVANMFLK